MIVNVGSVSGLTATPFAGAYSASKAALHALSDSLRVELAPLGISVVTIEAGALRTAFGMTALTVSDASLSPNSLFARYADAIRRRARASDESGMDPGDFAQIVVDRLERRPPPRIIRLGPLSKTMAFLRLLPTGLRDRILARKFGLSAAPRVPEDG